MVLGFAMAGAGLLPQGTAGALDPTFGSGGIVITELNVDSWANSVAIQGDGKLVAGVPARQMRRVRSSAAGERPDHPPERDMTTAESSPEPGMQSEDVGRGEGE